MSEPNWTLMPHIVALLDRLETRLCAAPPVDGLKCCGLWLKLYGDGSGSVMCEYRRAKVDETPAERSINAVFMEPHELTGFDSLEVLHGHLVAHTCSVRRSEDTEEGDGCDEPSRDSDGD